MKIVNPEVIFSKKDRVLSWKNVKLDFKKNHLKTYDFFKNTFVINNQLKISMENVENQTYWHFYIYL